MSCLRTIALTLALLLTVAIAEAQFGRSSYSPTNPFYAQLIEAVHKKDTERIKALLAAEASAYTQSISGGRSVWYNTVLMQAAEEIRRVHAVAE